MMFTKKMQQVFTTLLGVCLMCGLVCSSGVTAAHAMVSASTLASVNAQADHILALFQDMKARQQAQVLGARTVLVSTPTELHDALIAAQPGDDILLASGNYGTVTIQGDSGPRIIVNDVRKGVPPVLNGTVRIMSQDATHPAIFERFKIQNSNFWTIEQVQFLPMFGGLNGFAVTLRGENLVLRDSVIRFGATKGDVNTWDASEWVAYVGSGVSIGGNNNTVENNIISNVYTGISAGGDGSRVLHNIVQNIANDGLRGLGDNSLFEGNLVKNAFSINATHRDGFQSFSNGPEGPGSGVVRNVTLRDNTFIAHVNPTSELAASFQGIGMFDGEFHNWLIEDNLILVDHYHGISLAGSHGSTIRNNTVLDGSDRELGRTWIRLSSHKNGTPGSNNIIENNISNKFLYLASTTQFVNNMAIPNNGDYPNIFVDPSTYNFALKTGGSVGIRTVHDILTPTVTIPTDEDILVPPVVVDDPEVSTTTDDVDTEEEADDEDADSDDESSQGSVTITGLRRNQEVSGMITVRATPRGFASVTSVTFSIGTKQINVDTAVPYVLGEARTGVFDTTTLPDGQYNLAVKVVGAGAQTTELRTSFKVKNGTLTSDPVSSSTLGVVSSKVSVVTTDIVNVRISPNGGRLATQPARAVGIKDTATTMTAAGLLWSYVDFATGPDGYVADMYLMTSGATTSAASVDLSRAALIAQLRTQLLNLQLQLLRLLQAL